MKIAVVGKGGSGKTTIASLIATFLSNSSNKNTWLIDADINMHLAEQFLFLKGKELKPWLSNNSAKEDILKYLIGKNKKIKSTNFF